jgi:hypothetical protein
MQSVVGMFDTRSEADAATERLQELGIGRDRLSVAYKANPRTNQGSSGIEVRHRDTEGMSSDPTSRSGVSVLASLVIASRTIKLPGMGTFAVGGPLFASPHGVGLGGLIDAGIPKEEAGHFMTALERGQIIVAADVESVDVFKVRTVLEEHGSLRTYNS